MAVNAVFLETLDDEVLKSICEHVNAIADLPEEFFIPLGDETKTKAELADAFLRTHKDGEPVDPTAVGLFADMAFKNGMTDQASADALKQAAQVGNGRQGLEGLRNLSEKFRPKYVSAAAGSGVRAKGGGAGMRERDDPDQIGPLISDDPDRIGPLMSDDSDQIFTLISDDSDQISTLISDDSDRPPNE